LAEADLSFHLPSCAKADSFLRNLKASCVPGLIALGIALLASGPVRAEPWLPPGSLTVRHDIQLLADAGIIRSPATTYPMSWPDISRSVLEYESADELDGYVAAALARVQRLAREAAVGGFSGFNASVSAADNPQVLRTFSDTPREEGGAAVEGAWLGGRFAAKVNVSAVANASDGKDVRLDGSYLGVTLGNFILSAGSIERWWGPGWEGSLILSTNARPVPGISIDRNYSDPFSWRGLRWLGPWRLSASMGLMEDSDVVVPNSRFFAARVSFRPLTWLDIGLSRTAQWCGEGRPCDLGTFTDLLAGRDNRNEALTIEEEPGNQMAGYDLRMRSPWKRIPAAAYLQLIGEDEAGGLPSRLLGLLGAETWGASRWGSYRMHVEYADTACNFSRAAPLFDCAYRNTLYPDGYSHRSRSLGHSLDSDGRMYALGAMLVRQNGDNLNVLVRRIELNRGGTPVDPAHTVSPASSKLKNLELQYNRGFAWGELGIGLGLDDPDEPRDRGSDVRGFLRWQQGF
jgi:hypothetical protein